jgi:malonyl-CoA O-methyltransferase
LSERTPAIDRVAARRRFERAARTYGQASRLEAEVGERMLERLQYVKLAPQRILDAGSGPLRESRALEAKYRRAQILAVDFSLGMLRGAPRRLPSLRRSRIRRVCADIARLPLAAGLVDLAWSNMVLHWVPEPLEAFKELHRVLAPEGLLMFSSLGPDTLKELRSAAGEPRVHRFIDMHDLGDMLVAAGFSAPVMDMEMLVIAYPAPEGLLADLRASGQTSARMDRSRALSGRRFGERLRAALAASSGANAQASFEVVYGHAWKSRPRKLSDGRDIMQFRPRSLR